MKFIVDLAVPPGADPTEVADALLDLLTDQGDDAPYTSCDGVEPDIYTSACTCTPYHLIGCPLYAESWRKGHR